MKKGPIMSPKALVAFIHPMASGTAINVLYSKSASRVISASNEVSPMEA